MQGNFIAGLCLLLVGCAKDYDVNFLNLPELYPYERFNFMLAENFQVRVDNKLYVVPKGFITDLASSPRALWSFYSPNDSRTIPASILHDYMYRTGQGISRKQADDIFYNALIEGKTKRSTAMKYYLGVRMFGWLVYGKNKK